MNAVCYRIKVPEGRRLLGCTVAGRRVPILPGEYLVHRLPARTHITGSALRFVGAHGSEHDVHIKLPEDADIARMLDVEVELAQDQ
ncbi:hypothetical protein [Roseateles asaccharophilus]|uniref:DUF1905 domain-containing protein n=1 Tax=Roseateles asaccharophilus TaxID=582607 RepID=A0ABU2ABI0_9BURK|nr:hypothetical protein [Roseateles asaccharophilus]MDR7334564.1 hypothetical protein [Roseateles asaccharophilus]